MRVVARDAGCRSGRCTTMIAMTAGGACPPIDGEAVGATAGKPTVFVSSTRGIRTPDFPDALASSMDDQLRARDRINRGQEGPLNQDLARKARREPRVAEPRASH